MLFKAWTRLEKVMKIGAATPSVNAEFNAAYREFLMELGKEPSHYQTVVVGDKIRIIKAIRDMTWFGVNLGLKECKELCEQKQVGDRDEQGNVTCVFGPYDDAGSSRCANHFTETSMKWNLNLNVTTRRAV